MNPISATMRRYKQDKLSKIITVAPAIIRSDQECKLTYFEVIID
jgi:hypothetical protein